MDPSVQADPRSPTSNADNSKTPEPRSSLPMAIRYAAACGTLVGFAEVLWSYRLPDINPTWRATLPASFGGLLQFLTIACVTNILLFSIIILTLAALMCLLRFALKKQRKGNARPLRIRWCLLAGTLSYLLIGWLGLFILVVEEIGILSLMGYAGVALIGVTGITLPIAWMLDHDEPLPEQARRVERPPHEARTPDACRRVLR